MLLDSEDLWTRIAGAAIIVMSIVNGYRRHIGVELEGEPSSFAITGCAAVALAVITAAFGVFMLIWPDVLFWR